jgi:hypothetical protein
LAAEDNREFIRSYLQAIDDNAMSDWSILDRYIAADFVAHTVPLPGVSLDRQGMKQAAETFRVATPGKHEVTLQVARETWW